MIYSGSWTLSVIKWKTHPRTEFGVLEQGSQGSGQGTNSVRDQVVFQKCSQCMVWFLGLSSAGPGAVCWWSLWGPSKISDISACPKVFQNLFPHWLQILKILILVYVWLKEDILGSDKHHHVLGICLYNSKYLNRTLTNKFYRNRVPLSMLSPWINKGDSPLAFHIQNIAIRR